LGVHLEYKSFDMSTTELKADLHNYIDTISDSSILKAIHTLLKKHFRKDAVGYEPSGKAITKEALLKRLALAEKQFKDGKFVTIEEPEKESENW